MSAPMQLSEEEYLEIEEALSALARGRAFLRLRDQRSRVIALDEARRLMRGIKDTVRRAPSGEAEQSPPIRILRQELQEMSACIQQTRTEIAALRPDNSGSSRIMEATGELDAIVSATERATSEILSAAERVQELASKLPKDDAYRSVVADLEAQVIEILTACSFQDITGQRTTKVVNTLRYLERRVNSMIEIWGVQAGTPGQPPGERSDGRPDAHLLNGPPLTGGVSQDDVDALLATIEPKPPSDSQKAAEPARPATPPTATAAVAHVNGKNAPPPAAAGVSIDQSAIDALFN